MIFRSLKDILGTEREVKSPAGKWVSKRLLIRKDEMGFSFHDTTVFAGQELEVWYKNHLEACYCISGEGEVETPDGKRYSITPGTIYALDQHDKHTLHAKTDLRLICIFNPALTGTEIPDKDGSYPLLK